ncbi:MAG: glycoside hydrolase family 2 protein [Promethearchaeota archaeon]
MADLKRIVLSDSFWKFRFGLKQKDKIEDPGITEKWFETGIPNEKSLKVYVPSTWSYFQNRRKFNHFGTGWYETSFYLPLAWSSGEKKVTLVFNGSNYKTIVWLNDKKVGIHEGGYTKFWFEINKFVKFGADNKLIIQVDNRYGENRLPWFYPVEWMNYGGIYRPVYLKLTSQVCFYDIKISNQIKFENPVGQGCKGCKVLLNIHVNIRNFNLNRPKFDGFVVLTIKDGLEPVDTEIPISLTENGNGFFDIDFPLNNPHLWSPNDPHLHNLTFQLLDKNRREIDREALKWGIRDFKIVKNDFYLNNSKIKLRGINRHEDHPDVGSSMNPRLNYNDLNIMKEAHINCIRTSHYPPYESLLTLADEMGFLVIEEAPLRKLGKEQYNSKYLVNAQQQLWEMIHRDKNHCSVIAWSISSDCDTSIEEGREFMRTLIEISRELDPFRYHTLVPSDIMNDLTIDLVDFVCINVYMGWKGEHNVKLREISGNFEIIHKKLKENPNFKEEKPLIISEFGCGAIAGFKSFSFARWSENYQYVLIETYITEIMERDYIGGGFISTFQDFRSSPKSGYFEHPKEYINNGIVDMHRNPKIAYYMVQNLYKKWKDKIK